jgi:hypothetical protein
VHKAPYICQTTFFIDTTITDSYILIHQLGQIWMGFLNNLSKLFFHLLIFVWEFKSNGTRLHLGDWHRKRWVFGFQSFYANMGLLVKEFIFRILFQLEFSNLIFQKLIFLLQLFSRAQSQNVEDFAFEALNTFILSILNCSEFLDETVLYIFNGRHISINEVIFNFENNAFDIFEQLQNQVYAFRV